MATSPTRVASRRLKARDADLSRRQIADLTKTVRSVLTPNLLKPVFKKKVESGAHPMTGHCYVASEAMFHMLGGKDAGLKPNSVRMGDCIHWWLETSTGQIIDPTFDQFDEKVPYHEGRGRGFLTRGPSKRAQEVIRRVEIKLAP